MPDTAYCFLWTSGNVLMVESKVKLSRTDLALLSHQYDVRVNAATEEPQASLPPHLYDKWTLGTTLLSSFSYVLLLISYLFESSRSHFVTPLFLLFFFFFNSVSVDYFSYLILLLPLYPTFYLLIYTSCD